MSFQTTSASLPSGEGDALLERGGPSLKRSTCTCRWRVDGVYLNPLGGSARRIGFDEQVLLGEVAAAMETGEPITDGAKRVLPFGRRPGGGYKRHVSSRVSQPSYINGNWLRPSEEKGDASEHKKRWKDDGTEGVDVL